MSSDVVEAPPSRRVLVTGLSTYWGGRLAQALEGFEQIEAIIGVDSRDPTLELERTEFVKVSNQHSLLQRIVRAAEIDTVVDARMIVNSLAAPVRVAHENNVIGTMNILAACSGADSPVRKVVFKSSTHFYGSEQDDPAFFGESMNRPHAPATLIERDVVEAERSVAEFSARRPEVTVTLLRCANVLGPDVETGFTRMLSLPLVPMVLGFDPRLQFVHEDDVIRAMIHVLDHQLPGIYNVAGDGLLPWSEVAAICGKRTIPLPPFGFRGLIGSPLTRLGIELTPELVDLLRFGRGVDNRRLQRAGFRYGYTSAGTVEAYVEAMRLRNTFGGESGSYHYERDVENFFRHSPAVVRDEV
jgi:UDP-glucose 4-epimerase